MLSAIAVGCQKSEPSSQSVSGDVFTASVETFDAQTKTAMTPEKQIVWSENDRLAIFRGSSLADEYKVSSECVGQMNGKFTRVSSAENDDYSSGMELSTNVAFYPYAENLSLTGSVLEDETVYSITGVVIPSTQTYVAGSFGNGAFPMVAVTETMADHNLKFKNVLGAMKLQLKGVQTVKSIKVEGKNNEKLSGAATVTTYTNGLAPTITLTSTDAASKSVTLDCGTGVALNESTATDFIIALPPVLFCNGFTVTVTDTEDKTYTIEASTANAVLRSSILTMPVVTLGQDPENGNDDDSSSIKVLDIGFDKSTLNLAPSTTYSIISVVVPSTAENKTLTWSSSAPTVATVDQSGVVTAVSDGMVIITAVAVGGASESCTVNVISVPTSTATKDYVDEYNVNHGKGIAIGGTVWAPVNCGYKAATVEDEVTTDEGYPYGKLYQWGRKYGQGYSEYYDSEPEMYPGPVSAIIGQDKSMEGYFFINSDNWLEISDNSIWNSGTEESPVKTTNDPCPTGWRVPTKAELNALRQDSSDWTTKDGQNGVYFSGFSITKYDTDPLGGNKPQVFFPSAGYLKYSGGDAINRDYLGYYWSSCPYGFGESSCLYFRNYDGAAYIDDYFRASGLSVRCVQITD